MPLRITEKDSANCGTLLKVEGSLYLQDAELLEKICGDIREQTTHPLTLDLADLTFLDSESASVLCRLKREQNVSLEGLQLFIAKVIELTEAEAMVSEYLVRGNQSECEREFHNDTSCSDPIHRRIAAASERNI